MQPKTPVIATFLLVLFLASTFQAKAQCFETHLKPSKVQKIPASSLVLNDDINNDGKKDLISFAVNPSNLSNSSINVQLKVTDGFQANPTSTQINAPSRYFEAKIGDVNGDGLKDIVMAFNTEPRTVVTYINNGNSGFTISSSTAMTSTYEFLNSVIDLNGDGKADLLTLSNTHILYYRLAQANNSFGSPVQLMNNIYSAFAGKFNDDNNNDIVVYVLTPGANTYSVLKLVNQGGGNFSSSGADQVYGFEPKAVGDLNNDGILDLVSAVDRNSSNNSIFEFHIYIAANQGVLTKSTKSVNPDYGFGEPLIGDFNGDGLNDIAGGGNMSFYINRTGSDFTETNKTHVAGDSFFVTDFNGDGKDDIFALRGTGIFDIYNYNFRSVRFYENSCTKFGQTRILDFNDDGREDNVFWRPNDGRWSSSNFQSSNSQTFYWGISTNDIPVPNDYDGDGKTDYAVYRKSEGNWYIFRSSDNAWMGLQFGTAEDKPVPTDFDNDGKADIAVYRPSNGGWYVIKSASNSFLGLQFGIAEDKPVPMDFNGDNQSDFAVYRPSTGVWYILHSSDYSFRAIPFGISTDTPIPADYDLDGKADIAVFRDGIWYMLLSGDNSVFYYRLGTTGDIPFAYGAYSIPAVYRPSQFRIYYHQYSEPQIISNIGANDNFISILPRY